VLFRSRFGVAVRDDHIDQRGIVRHVEYTVPERIEGSGGIAACERRIERRAVRDRAAPLKAVALAEIRIAFESPIEAEIDTETDRVLICLFIARELRVRILRQEAILHIDGFRRAEIGGCDEPGIRVRYA